MTSRIVQILFLTIIALSAAFAPLDALGAGRFQLRNISIEEGLSQSSVTSVFRDSQGFLWIGTRHGLNRFDNSTMKNYYHAYDDPYSIPNSEIRNIFEDDRNTVWVLCQTGMARYDRANDCFKQVVAEGDAASRYVKPQGYCLTPNGIIFGGPGRLFFFDYSTNKLSQIIQQGSKRYYFAILPWRSNQYLLATRFDGMWIFDTDKHTITRYDQVKTRHLTDAKLDHKGNLWYTPHNGGLVCIDRNGVELARLTTANSNLSSDQVSNIQIREDYIYIANEKGIDIYSFKTGNISSLHAFGELRELSSVSMVYLDKYDNIYAGTNHNGLNLFHTVAMETYTDLKSETAPLFSALVDGGNGRVYCATDGNGVLTFDHPSATFTPFASTSGMKVTSMIDYDPTRLLLSTQDNTIWLLDKRTGALSHAPGPFATVSNRHHNSHLVLTMYRINPTTLFAVSDSVYAINQQTGSLQVVDSINVREHGRLIPFYSDSTRLLLNSHKSLISVELPSLRAKTLFHNDDDDDTKIFAASYIGNDSIIIAADNGIYTFAERAMTVSKVATPPIHNIGMTFFENGRVWIGADGRLFMFDGPRQFTFGHYDGVAPNEFFARATLATPEHLYFGGNNGLLAISRDEFDSTYLSQLSPEIELSLIDIMVDGLPATSNINGRVLEIGAEVQMLSGTVIDNEANPWRGKLFRFYIEGENETYMLETYDRSFTVGDFQPGESYVVSASCNGPEGTWTEPQKLLTIKVKYPTWRSLAAIVLYVAIALIVTSLLLRISWNRARRNRMQVRQQMLDKEVKVARTVISNIRKPASDLYHNLDDMLSELRNDLSADDPIVERMQALLDETHNLRDIIERSADKEVLEKSMNGQQEPPKPGAPEIQHPNEEGRPDAAPQPSRPGDDNDDDSRLTAAQTEFLNHIDSIIDRGMSSPTFGIDSLLRETSMRCITLESRLSDITGFSVDDYIALRRIERAKKLLLTTTDSIEQIAVAVGCPSPSDFEGFFTSNVGLSPKRFRDSGGYA